MRCLLTPNYSRRIDTGGELTDERLEPAPPANRSPQILAIFGSGGVDENDGRMLGAVTRADQRSRQLDIAVLRHLDTRRRGLRSNIRQHFTNCIDDNLRRFLMDFVAAFLDDYLPPVRRQPRQLGLDLVLPYQFIGGPRSILFTRTCWEVDFPSGQDDQRPIAEVRCALGLRVAL